MAFDGYVSEHRMKIPNRPDIFGHQYIMDENEEIAGEEEDLLISAADLSLEDAYRMVLERGGVCFPAHIDRPSNGIIETLGTFPEDPAYTAYELNDASSFEQYQKDYPLLSGLRRTVSSDAHYLWNIAEASFSIPLDDEPYSSDLVRNRLIDYLLGKTEGEEPHG